MSRERVSCGICGGEMVEIRGRYPENHLRRDRTRIVCPTCLAERMDQIREIASSRLWEGIHKHTAFDDSKGV